jgi:hypothetical protein
MNLSGKRTMCASLVLMLALPSNIFADGLKVPAENPAKFAEAVKTAQQEGNYAGALRESKRWLESVPNEPLAQAAVYEVMSAAAEKSGDAEQAKNYSAMAMALDPKISERLKAAEEGGVVTRGGEDKMQTFLTIAVAAMQTVQQVQEQRKEAKAQRAMAKQQQGGYNYPAAPVGNAGYQAPQGGYAPMPGYANTSAPPQQAPQGAYASPQAPPANPYGGGGNAPAPYASAGNRGGQAPAPYGGSGGGAQPYGNTGGAAPAPYANPSGQGYAPAPYVSAEAQRAPAYGASKNYKKSARRTRGDEEKPVRVVHDHYRVGDAAYFADGCGALLAVEDGNLTFTPGGGEEPLVIPASEIAEIKMNTQVGKEAGAFHVTTKQGLYLNLAPESGAREAGTAAVASLKKQLGMSE